MQIKSVKIHNFASIIDEEIYLGNYNLLIGENNSGKSNTINAIRAFYGELKYEPILHKPNAVSDDDVECWVQIVFQLESDDEWEKVGVNYKSVDNTFTVRHCLTNCITDGKELKAGSNYVYTSQGWENKPFKGNLGRIIFIQAVSKLSDELKTTGPSPFRDILDRIIRDIVNNNDAFKKLNNDISEFAKVIKSENSGNSLSISSIVSQINNSLSDRWNVEFTIDVGNITSDLILKNLIEHYIIDKTHSKRQQPQQFGAGLQRELIFHLIRIDAQHTTKEIITPTIYLFEEPEAFLHPNQQIEMAKNLINISKDNGTQVVVSSHSPHFVSYQSDDLTSIIRLHKQKTTVYGMCQVV